MASWNIAVVGATGQVGSALVELLQNSTLIIDKLTLIASDSGEGEIVRFSGKNLTVSNINEVDWSAFHFVFFAVPKAVSQQYAPIAAQSGCIVIDASGSFADNLSVPLIIPKINNEVLQDYRNENIIAIAHPIAVQALRSVASLINLQELTNLQINSLLPASFYGKKGTEELASQSIRLLNGLPVEAELFDKQVAFNVLSRHHDKVVDDKGLVNQIKRILCDDQITVMVDSLLGSIFYGVTQSINFSSLSASYINEQLNNETFSRYGIELLTNDYPTPVTIVNSGNSELKKIQIANLRYGDTQLEWVQFNSVSDNIRYLGAQVLLETAEVLVNDYLEQ